MKTTKIILITTIALLMSGCLFTTKPKLKYPEDIAAMCTNARNETQTWIQEHYPRLELRTKANVTVVKVPGEVFINGLWGFAEPSYPQYWVGGSYNGSVIKVGCNPVTGNDVSYGVLKHEFGHYWLFPSGIYGHPAGFESIFGFSGDAPFNTSTIFNNSNVVHIDIIKEK